MTTWRELLRAGPGLRLADIDAASTPGWVEDEERAEAETAELLRALDDLQMRLFAGEQHSLLVVLQGRDTSGKDGAIRKVLGAMSPLGFRVHSFRAPVGEEVEHDFLWRAHARVPGRGEVVVFNRSHYEDVLVRRVHAIDTEEQWRPRFGHIRAFEALLAGDNGTSVLKVMLHISKEEQAERFGDRLDEPAKRWKFRLGDLDDRAKWAEFDAAYEEAIAESDADHAPWYVVPANRKWYRDLAVAHLVHETLDALDLAYPEPEEDLSDARRLLGSDAGST